MIITKLRGGLGNQLFQYAAGRQLAQLQHTDLKLDLSYYSSPSATDTPRVYKLDKYPIQATLVSGGEEDRILGVPLLRPLKRRLWKMGIDIFRWNYFREDSFGYHPYILQFRGEAILHGYWQSECYFPTIRAELLQELALKDEFVTKACADMKIEMQASESVAVHIRRGDYAHNPNVNQDFGLCPPEYYKNAMRKLGEELKSPVFYLFSDDLAWCRTHFPPSNTVRYVSNFEDYQDLMLISSCRHQIIANSSFSWWGAWLNVNPCKIVITPNIWFANSQLDTSHVVPANWIRL